MEKSTSEKIKLGIFVIVGTILLVLAAYLIGNRQNMFGQSFTILSEFRHVNGLQKGNNVRYSGINVGTVQSIEMENDTVIQVYMLIDESMRSHIKKNAVASIGSDGLVGSMIVNIVPGNGPSEPVNPGDEIPSYTRLATTDMLSTLNITNENAALLTADLLEVTKALKNGQGTLGRLLNDPDMANDLTATIKNLRIASRETNSLITELRTVLDTAALSQSAAGILLTDPIAGERVDTTIQNLRDASRQLNATLATLDTLASDLAHGEGALQYIASDTLLVRRISNTMENIEEGTARFNQNMEALKHNFLTRRYFRKLEREQKKAERD